MSRAALRSIRHRLARSRTPFFAPLAAPAIRDGARICTIACSVLGIMAGAVRARAEEAPARALREESRSSSSLEVWGAIGPSVTFGEPANPEYTRSFRRVGYTGELGVAYRSSYFVDPFVLVSYANLASGEAALPSGTWGEGGTLEQYLSTWVIAPGITTDLWRFRLRYGLGVAIVAQGFRFGEQENSSTQLPLANQFGVGFNAFNGDRLRLDAEAKFVTAGGADVSYGALSLVMRGDLVQFGGAD
jgi:hypothetical protein